MNIHSADFTISAPNLASCPASDHPEVALIGRSNVGKSSLINLLTNQKGLAKVSATPGRTRLINFFLINQKWHLVDLPGYGYAKASRRDRQGWSASTADYLAHRPNLRGVLVLIDARLPPQPIDLDFLLWLANRTIPFALVFTKTDKLKPRALAENIAAFRKSLAAICEGEPDHLVSSSITGAGRKEILRLIADSL